MSLAKDWGS